MFASIVSLEMVELATLGGWYRGNDLSGLGFTENIFMVHKYTMMKTTTLRKLRTHRPFPCDCFYSIKRAKV